MSGPQRLWRTADLALGTIDRLPFGAIVVDAAGTIVGYNEYETRLSLLARERVIGKNFFRDVAPCTAVAAFEGRMQAFLRTQDRISESFDYFFAFAHGTATVEITFLRLPELDRVLIAVERTYSLIPD